MNSGVGSNFKVRRMRAADVENVVEIAAGLKDAPHWLASVYHAALEPDRMPRRVALVAESPTSGEVIGFAVANILPPQAELESIAVRFDRQRQGIGRFLLGELSSELKAAAVSELLLEVRASNHVARSFYGVAGWRESGNRPRYYADPEEDAILMSLALG